MPTRTTTLAETLLAIAAELRDLVRAQHISAERDWAALPERQREAALLKVAAEFSVEWGEERLRGLANYYVELRGRREQTVKIDTLVAKIAKLVPELEKLSQQPRSAFRSEEGQHLPARAASLLAVTSAEHAARVAARRLSDRAAVRIERRANETSARRNRLDAALRDLPPHGKEWTYYFARYAYEEGLGPAQAAKLEALVAHEFFPGIVTAVTGTAYVPVGVDHATSGARKTATSRWEGAYRQIGVGAPNGSPIKFSRADGHPILGLRSARHRR